LYFSENEKDDKTEKRKEQEKAWDQFIVDFINDPVLPAETPTEQAGLNYQTALIHSSMGRQIVVPSMVYYATN
jgi:hypothetical protein